MPLFQPDVLRPSEHRLVIRHGTTTGWLTVAGLVWCLGWWYAVLLYYRSALAGVQWLWWSLMLVPIVSIALAYRSFTDLFDRCRRGDEFVFDSLERTVTRSGKLVAHFQDVSKVILHVFRPDRERDDSSTGRIQLADGSKIDLARSFVPAQEKFVEQLTKDVAALLGKKVEIDYAGARHLESIRSLNLSRLDDEEQ